MPPAKKTSKPAPQESKRPMPSPVEAKTHVANKTPVKPIAPTKAVKPTLPILPVKKVPQTLPIKPTPPAPIKKHEPLPLPAPEHKPAPPPIQQVKPEPKSAPVSKPIPEPLPVPEPIHIPAPVHVPAPAPKPSHHPIATKEETLVKGIKEVEAVLFASGKSMEEEHIVQLTGLRPQEAKKALAALKESYEKRDSALFIWNEGDRWKINVKEVYISLVKSLVAETELSRAVLETLAVIAYRSPALQADIIKSRGDGAYEHINELVEKGFVTKEKLARSFKLRVADKFYHYFDVEGSKGLKETLDQAKKPNVERIAAKEQRKLGDLEIVPATPDEETEAKMRQERQLEIYSIEQQREDDKKNYLNGFEQRLGEVTERIHEAEKDILEEKRKAEELRREEELKAAAAAAEAIAQVERMSAAAENPLPEKEELKVLGNPEPEEPILASKRKTSRKKKEE